MNKVVVKTEYKVYWPDSGFPTTSSGPYKTAEEAASHIERYTGSEKMKRNAYICKLETTSEQVPRPSITATNPCATVTTEAA